MAKKDKHVSETPATQWLRAQGIEDDVRRHTGLLLDLVLDLVAHVIRTAEGSLHLAVAMQCISPVGRRLGRVC
jgi:hypothetical protein